MTAREEVLTRVRTARTGAVSPSVPRTYVCGHDPGSLALLMERLVDYRAVVHRATGAEVPEILATVLRGRIVVPDGFPREWLAGVTTEVVRDAPMLTATELDALDAVVTTCALAIAETVVLDAGEGQGRRALSLVPDRHVVVVRATQVVALVHQALHLLRPTAPQTWISGPSATSDIELQRVEGVHGPRTLVVVIVEEKPDGHVIDETSQDQGDAT